MKRITGVDNLTVEKQYFCARSHCIQDIPAHLYFMYSYSFEKLEVWRLARGLVCWIYDITNSFPKDERFGLTMQLRRASVSVVSNLAEGTARNTARDQAHFTQIAYSSLIEILNQLIISNDLHFINKELLFEGRARIEQLTRRIATLRKAQLRKSTT